MSLFDFTLESTLGANISIIKEGLLIVLKISVARILILFTLIVGLLLDQEQLCCHSHCLLMLYIRF